MKAGEYQMQARVLSADQKEHLAQDQRPALSFFPVPEDFSEYIGVGLDELQGPKKVLVSLELLRALIGLAAGGSTYDPTYYKGKYQDLREAFEAGTIEDLFAHYVSQGYFEKRFACKEQAFPVDEDWYLGRYPDVAEGIKSGRVDSASDHYFTTGRREGRLPSGRVPLPIQRLIATLSAI
jgi:hypothetical protein